MPDVLPAPVSPQDFQEHYVQTGPGQLSVGSAQRFLQDGLPASLRCHHSIRYDAARGPQPHLVQHLRASAISSAFDPEAEALHFQLTTALHAGEAPARLHPALPSSQPARLLGAWARDVGGDNSPPCSVCPSTPRRPRLGHSPSSQFKAPRAFPQAPKGRFNPRPPG